MKKKGYLIFNPSAGMSRKSATVVSRVIRQFEEQGIDITPSPTEADYSVFQQVKDLVKEEPDLLVSWGGDGTINEVVNGMFGSDIPLGILPGGTANLCVRELKIPVRIPDAIRVIGRNKTKQISVGMANRRYFLLMVGVGFDSEVIKNVDWNLKKKIGTLAFGVAALKTAASYKFPKFTVKVDHTEKECIFAVICNGKEYGAYFQLVPEADLSDDFFYVCLFKEPGFASMVNYALHGLVSMHHKLKSVEIFKARKIEVKGGEEIPVQADGELIGYLPMKIKLLPKSLHVFVP